MVVRVNLRLMATASSSYGSCGGAVWSVNEQLRCRRGRSVTDQEWRTLARIRAAAHAGLDDVTIADHLNRDGYRPCRGTAFTPAIVQRLRCLHQILKGLERLRRGERPPGYTVLQVARLLKVDRSWISRKICRGQIRLEKDAHYGCYLFPRDRSTIDRLRELKNGKVLHVSFQRSIEMVESRVDEVGASHCHGWNLLGWSTQFTQIGRSGKQCIARPRPDGASRCWRRRSPPA